MLSHIIATLVYTLTKIFKDEQISCSITIYSNESVAVKMSEQPKHNKVNLVEIKGAIKSLSVMPDRSTG